MRCEEGSEGPQAPAHTSNGPTVCMAPGRARSTSSSCCMSKEDAAKVPPMNTGSSDFCCE